jgi:ribonuclease VapC
VTSVVLDASAVLAYALGERGADVVQPRLFGAIMSAVNYSEVLKKTLERGGDMRDTAQLLQGARVDVVPFDSGQAAGAAKLFHATKAKGLSFADRAALSLAIEMDAPLYTSDKRLADADVPIEVVLIREAVAAVGSRKKRK